MSPIELFIRRTVLIAKCEISLHIAAKILPAPVKSFAELHDHVDANEYGGLCTMLEEDLVKLFPLHPERVIERRFDSTYEVGEFILVANQIQDELDTWLKADRPQWRAY